MKINLNLKLLLFNQDSDHQFSNKSRDLFLLRDIQVLINLLKTLRKVQKPLKKRLSNRLIMVINNEFLWLWGIRKLKKTIILVWMEILKFYIVLQSINNLFNKWLKIKVVAHRHFSLSKKNGLWYIEKK